MQYSVIPFSLVTGDDAYLIDVDSLYAAAATLTDGRKPQGRRYPLALFVTVAVLANLAGFVRMEAVADWAKMHQHELFMDEICLKRATELLIGPSCASTN